MNQKLFRTGYYRKNGIVLIFSNSELKNNNKKQHATGRKGAATTNKDD